MLWVVDFIKKLPVSVLIDCSSTHNFINEPIAKQLRFSVIDVTALAMVLFDGN